MRNYSEVRDKFSQVFIHLPSPHSFFFSLSFHHWRKYSEFNSFPLDLFQSPSPRDLSVSRTECSNLLCLFNEMYTDNYKESRDDCNKNSTSGSRLHYFRCASACKARLIPLKCWHLLLILTLIQHSSPHPSSSRPHTSCGHQSVNTYEQTVQLSYVSPTITRGGKSIK